MSNIRNRKKESGVSLSQQLTDRILRDIQDGRIKLGSKLPSQSELMEQYDVSITTVRQLIANLERYGVIRREHGRGNFVSLQSRRPGDIKELRTLGLIFDYYDAPENVSPQNALVLAFREACRKRGIRLLYMELRVDEREEGRRGGGGETTLIETFKDSQIDGLCMFIQSPDRDKEITEALHREFPSAVTLVPGLLPHDLPTDLIEVDLQVGVRQLMKYFLSLGHRRIAYVGSAIKECLAGNPYATGGRWQAYREELVNAGIEIDPSLVVEIPFGQSPTAEISKQIVELVKRENPATAIFAQNDWMAGCVMRALWYANIRVPQEVSLAGFDNVVFALDLVPALTTVNFPFMRMAEMAVELVERRLEQPERKSQRITLPTELVIKETVGGGGGEMRNAGFGMWK